VVKHPPWSEGGDIQGSPFYSRAMVIGGIAMGVAVIGTSVVVAP
jgi:hypothetical protein